MYIIYWCLSRLSYWQPPSTFSAAVAPHLAGDRSRERHFGPAPLGLVDHLTAAL